MNPKVLHNPEKFATLSLAEARPQQMRWFRSTRFVPFLALYALACQFLLSFGHVHLDRISTDTAAWVVTSDAGNGATAELPGSPNKKPNGIGGDFCAICASISLASTAVAPSAPVIAAPESSIAELPWSLAAVEPARLDHFLFEARGPPHA